MQVEWTEVEAVLKEWLTQAERELEEAAGELFVGRSQGRIKTIKAVQLIPSIIEGRRTQIRTRGDA